MQHRLVEKGIGACEPLVRSLAEALVLHDIITLGAVMAAPLGRSLDVDAGEGWVNALSGPDEPAHRLVTTVMTPPPDAAEHSGNRFAALDAPFIPAWTHRGATAARPRSPSCVIHPAASSLRVRGRRAPFSQRTQRSLEGSPGIDESSSLPVGRARSLGSTPGSHKMRFPPVDRGTRLRAPRGAPLVGTGPGACPAPRDRAAGWARRDRMRRAHRFFFGSSPRTVGVLERRTSSRCHQDEPFLRDVLASASSCIGRRSAAGLRSRASVVRLAGRSPQTVRRGVPLVRAPPPPAARQPPQPGGACSQEVQRGAVPGHGMTRFIGAVNGFQWTPTRSQTNTRVSSGLITPSMPRAP